MKENRVLLLGATGMVGSQFVDSHSSNLNLLAPSREELDVTSLDSIKHYLDRNPDIACVVNAVAYTNLTEAQKQRGDPNSPCWLMNVTGAQNLADALIESDIFFLQISTDYVFPGDKGDPGPYAENHPLGHDPGRLSFYGQTKAVAEQILAEALAGRMAVLRLISPVVREYKRKLDCLRFPLAYYAKYGELYPVFTNQQTNITDVNEFCMAARAIIDKKAVGIFHAGSSDITTPYQIMIHLFDLVYGDHDMVKPGSIIEYLKTLDDPTRYHIYGGLLNKVTEKILGIHYSDSEAIINRLYGHISS